MNTYIHHTTTNDDCTSIFWTFIG